MGAVPAAPPGRGPASISFPGGGESAVTIKKEEKLFAFSWVLMTFQTSIHLSSLKQRSARGMNNAAAAEASPLT